jgi:hypothetical protein
MQPSGSPERIRDRPAIADGGQVGWTGHPAGTGDRRVQEEFACGICDSIAYVRSHRVRNLVALAIGRLDHRIGLVVVEAA